MCSGEKVHAARQSPWRWIPFITTHSAPCRRERCMTESGLPAPAPVMRRASEGGVAAPSGLVVIVQEDYVSAMDTVSQLGSRLLWGAAMALTFAGLTITALWLLLLRMLQEPPAPRRPPRNLASATDSDRPIKYVVGNKKPPTAHDILKCCVEWKPRRPFGAFSDEVELGWPN